MLLPVVVNLRAAVNDRKVRLESLELALGFWSNKHVGDKMLLPSHFMNKSNIFARLFRGSNIAIKDIGRVARVKMCDRLVEQLVKDLWLGRLINIIPVHVLGRLRARIQDNPSVLGRATRVLASVNGKRVTIFRLGHDALLVGDFVIKEFFIRQVAIHSLGASNTERVEIDALTSIGSGKCPRDLVGITTRRVEIQVRLGRKECRFGVERRSLSEKSGRRVSEPLPKQRVIGALM